MPLYIGLSFLSNSCKNGKAECRRILSGLENRPFNEGEIAKGPNGRPFFPERSVDFNLSHSGAMAAVSLAAGEGLRTGCDVQIVQHRRSIGDIAEEFFTAGERDYIFAGGEPRLSAPADGSGGINRAEDYRFFAIWTLKECYIKLRGLSVFDMASAPSFIGNPAASAKLDPSISASFYLYELASREEHYFLAAAFEGGKGLQPEIRWFSQPALPCRNILNGIPIAYC